MSTCTFPRPLGRYLLVRRLATGGMAEVYLAKSMGVGGFEKLVAIKRVHPGLRGTASSLAEEAKLSVSLTHPNIVQTFDLGHAEGMDFLVMEYVEGYDAQYVVEALRLAGADFPIDLAAHVMAQVCRGLDHAHEHRDGSGERSGIVHRDVSPQNILLSFAGEVKVADFGIAKTNARRSDPEARVIKGKYYYMSPEQTRAAPLDRRSDVFSSGIVLWELLCGRRLHDATDVRSLVQAVRQADVPPPSSIRSGVPAALDSIVARATARDPSGRFEDARAMGRALDEYLGNRPVVLARNALGALLTELPARPLSPARLLEPHLPQTRDRVATVSVFGRPAPSEPPLRYDLEDGSPTLVGWQSPVSTETHHRWIWTLAAGAATVYFAALWLHGL